MDTAPLTRMLQAAESGDRMAADQLLPLVYDELRRLASNRLAHEAPGQSLDATALVHEAYLRISGNHHDDQCWEGRAHFFAAAAEAMRRILIDRARHRATLKRGGQLERVDLEQCTVAMDDRPEEILALNEALAEFEQFDPQAAQLVKLRYFAGLSHHEAVNAMGVTRRAADRLWTLARAWLYRRIRESQ